MHILVVLLIKETYSLHLAEAVVGVPRRLRATIDCQFKPCSVSTIAMIPIGPVTTLNRSILKTERRMSGTGGDDFICGHCGYIMLEDFDPSTVSGNPVYQCGLCENNNDLPFAASNRRYWSSRYPIIL